MEPPSNTRLIQPTINRNWALANDFGFLFYPKEKVTLCWIDLHIFPQSHHVFFCNICLIPNLNVAIKFIKLVVVS
jgi:hypothetical protein